MPLQLPLQQMTTDSNYNYLYLLDLVSNMQVNEQTVAATTAAVTALQGQVVAQTDYQVFVGLNDILMVTTGTWTKTRVNPNVYVLRKTAASETDIICIDVNEAIRTTLGKGFTLTSVDVVYSIGTIAMTSAAISMNQVNYTTNLSAIVSPNILAATALPTAVQTISGIPVPYVTNVAVVSPQALNQTDSHYTIEFTGVFPATTTFDWYGIQLNFEFNQY